MCSSRLKRPGSPRHSAGVPQVLQTDLGKIALAAVLCLAAAIAAVWTDSDATRARATTVATGAALDELAFLAGLENERGERMRAEAFPVEVVQEAGPQWLRPSVQAAVGRSGTFASGDSPHLLRIEPIVAGDVIIVQLRLWRQGWDLRTPQPFHLRVAPWVPILAGLLGVSAGLLTRRASVGVLVAGLFAQLGLLALPWPSALLGEHDWSAEVRRGPLVRGVERIITGSPEMATAVAASVIVFSLVLVVFDHRRSQASPANMGLGLAAVLAFAYGTGAIAWIEAASRSGTTASVTGVPGVVAHLALAGAFGIVGWRAVLRGRAELGEGSST